MIGRRKFITLLGGATAWPLAARAQQAKTPVIGFLGSESPGLTAGALGAFLLGLAEAGFVEGRNVALEYRWAEGRYDRLPGLAADLVRRQVTVIFATPGVSGQAAKAATTSIPIVFSTGIDPINYGLVTSLSHPGGNLTGVSTLAVELGAKRLDLLHELVPTATTIGYLTNPTNPADIRGPNITDIQEAAARSLGLKLLVLEGASENDFDAVFARMLIERAGALLMTTDPFLGARSAQLAALTVRHAMPAMFARREGVAAGALASYGTSNESAHRLAASYVGRILKGEKPGDLPVQQSTKVDLVLNLKTAKALGLTVPLPLLGLADEVFE
jgi:putative ABC transport system substrate-binding protein